MTPETRTAIKTLAEQTLNAIRTLHQQEGITPDSLKKTAALLERLAASKDLFSFANFPLPQPGEPLSTRYELYVGEGQEYALYLQSLLPGKKSPPHNHKTWAVIVGIEGEEVSRIYQRVDDRSQPGKAQLELVGKVPVRQGNPGIFTGEDIHSIHIEGQEPALQFHLYGKALESLTDREGFNLETGEVTGYNQAYWRPSAPL